MAEQFTDVEVSGGLATNGLSSASNAPGDPQGAGFPSWSGRGVNAWDVIARGAVYAGTNIEDPQVQIYSNGRILAGSVQVSLLFASNITAAAKNFRIDYPGDPNDRFLVHACLEGPENAVYYRGAAHLINGRCEVALPCYFEALTAPVGRTVLLTPCCEADDTISTLAATDVTDGRFLVRAIDCQNPSQRFFWEVKAIRADIDPLLVEVRKDTLHESGGFISRP